MRIFKISQALKQELRQQRKIVFGKHRYWFHIALWVTIFIIAVVQNTDFERGIRIGIETGEKKVSYDPLNSGFSLLLSGITAAVMVYGFLLFMLPLARYRKQKRFLWVGLFINGGLWLFTLFLAGVISGFTTTGTNVPSVAISVSVVATVTAMIPAYFFALYYFIDLYDQQKNLTRFQQVFTDKLQAETAFLKTQINPHFLFNTLNNIYSLALRQSDDAPVIARQLKELSQYMLYDCTQDMVPLSGEVTFLHNYISLEQLRNKQDDIDIQLEVRGDTEGRQIAPLLLVNFIENAFKHGVKSGIDRAFVHINLLIMDRVLSMEVTNSRPPAPARDLAVKEAGGIGIKNVRRRLELLYPGKHRLKINQSKQRYSVHLNIEL